MSLENTLAYITLSSVFKRETNKVRVVVLTLLKVQVVNYRQLVLGVLLRPKRHSYVQPCLVTPFINWNESSAPSGA